MPGRWRGRAAATVAAALLLFAAGNVEAAKCGTLAGGAGCFGADECCSIWGYCGTGDRFCGPGRCYSGACVDGGTATQPPAEEQGGSKPPPSPKPVQPAPEQQGDTGTVEPAPQTSMLWGKSGEAWRPSSHIVDHSWAGYMGQQRRIPAYQDRVFNVKKYGAKGDGVADDTQAILDAVEAASAAAFEMGTVVCGPQSDRRCLPPHSGFLNEGSRGAVVLLPPGTYKVTQTIEITQSNVVLRGAGTNKTTLYFPKPLKDIYGNTQVWAFGGAFILLDGNNAGSNQAQYKLTAVTADARKGARRLQVESTEGIEVGQWIRLYALAPSPARRRLHAAPANASLVEDEPGYLPLTPALRRQAVQARQYAASEAAPEGVTSAAQPGTLDAYLYGENLADSGKNAFEGTDHIRFPARVVAKGRDWIQLERPLPYEIRTKWNPFVYQFYATVQHVGVESLTMRFAWGVYPSHLGSYGWNAIAVQGVANAWVQWVNIINADNGVLVTASDFVTVRGVRLRATKPRYTAATFPDNGHHALWVGRSGDVWFDTFFIDSPVMHDLSVDGFAERTVFSRGKGANMNIDCHRAGPHNHLFTDLDMGLGTRPFKSGGEASRGAHSGANNTFWNLRASKSPTRRLQLPDCDFGPQLTFVGQWEPPKGLPMLKWEGAAPRDIEHRPDWCRKPTAWQVEQVPPGKLLVPQDLFRAQLARRLANRAP